jgi:hypothetical protein
MSFKSLKCQSVQISLTPAEFSRVTVVEQLLKLCRENPLFMKTLHSPEGTTVRYDWHGVRLVERRW